MGFFQLHHPFMRLSTDRQLEWRTLFPMLGHYLSFIPTWLFFAIPHIFCLGLLWYVARLVLRRTGNLMLALLATSLASTSGAYMVSMGFLGYFDSALLLCILVCCFEGKALPVWAAASLGCWIDDRFVLALPIILWCQWRQGWARSFLWTLLGCLPYLALRLLAITGNGDDSQSILASMTKGKLDTLRILQGLWDGLRWGWLLIIPAFIHARKWQIAYGLTVVPLAILVLELIAGDFSRSVGVALPLVILGIISINPRWITSKIIPPIWIAALIIINYTLPAYYSFRPFHARIMPVWTQIQDAREFYNGIVKAHQRGWKPRFYLNHSQVRETKDTQELMLEVPSH